MVCRVKSISGTGFLCVTARAIVRSILDVFFADWMLEIAGDSVHPDSKGDCPGGGCGGGGGVNPDGISQEIESTQEHGRILQRIYLF